MATRRPSAGLSRLQARRAGAGSVVCSCEARAGHPGGAEPMRSMIRSCQTVGCMWPAEFCQPTTVVLPGVGELEVLLCSWDRDRVTAGLAGVEQQLTEVGRDEDDVYDDSGGVRGLLAWTITATRSTRSIQVIQEKVASYYGLATADLKGPRRHRYVVLARHVAMYLVREETPASLPVIGDSFGD